MEAIRKSEMLVTTYKTTWRHNPEDYVKMTVFWDNEPFSLVEIGQQFRGTYCLHIQGFQGSKHL
jgi:hypothetical protein